LAVSKEEEEEEEQQQQYNQRRPPTREQQEYEERRKRNAKDVVVRLHQIKFRRDAVFNLSSQSLSQYEIAKVLRVSQPLINSDLQYLRAQFREALRNHIEHELPLIYNQTMNGISQVIQRAYAIHDTPRVPEQIRLHALNLIAECQQRRLDMATSGSTIEQGLSYVERMRANVNNLVRAIPQDQVREILHDEEAEEVLLGDDESSESERNNDGDSDISDGGDVHVSDGEDLNGNEDSSSASTS
jgi:hypothetical protein